MERTPDPTRRQMARVYALAVNHPDSVDGMRADVLLTQLETEVSLLRKLCTVSAHMTDWKARAEAAEAEVAELRAALGEATPEAPIYRKVPHDDGWATQLYMIVCDEGWRESIVCERMYVWAADWLLDILGNHSYVNESKPDAD
jgi:hypothetical protein